MKGVKKVVHPKKLCHCPVCGIAITVDTTVRIRPAPGQQDVRVDRVNNTFVAVADGRAEDDSDG